MSVEDILKDEEALRAVAKTAFDNVDVDHSGYVDEHELSNLMTGMAGELGITPPKPHEIKEAFKAMDTDKNGKVTLDEFTILVKQILQLMK